MQRQFFCVIAKDSFEFVDEYVCNGSSTYSFEMDTEAGKLCYELLDNSLFNYAEAKNECINQGGTLAMEKDSETTQALNSNIPL